jgi:hypothetical protein
MFRGGLLAMVRIQYPLCLRVTYVNQNTFPTVYVGFVYYMRCVVEIRRLVYCFENEWR